MGSPEMRDAPMSYPMRFGYVNQLRRRMREDIGRSIDLMHDGQYARALDILAFIAEHSDECDKANPEIVRMP